VDPVTHHEAGARTPTPLDAIAEDYLLRYAALDPVAATVMGLAEHADALTDYSPDGAAARADLHRDTLAKVMATPPRDEVDRVTAEALIDQLQTASTRSDAGEDLRDINVAASPVQSLRDVFDVTPSQTTADLESLAARLHALPTAVQGYLASLRAGIAAGLPPARRQVEACAVQCDDNVGPDGFFHTFVARLAGRDGVPPALAQALTSGGAAASQAFATLAGALRADIAGGATDADAFGRERYALASRAYLGLDIDPEETYAWGIEELRHWRAEGDRVAEQLGVTDLAAAVDLLDTDPARRIQGAAAFRDWMQQVSDEAVTALAGTHFDIPPQARRLDCKIAPSSTGIIYYSGPSEDFSRPGTMWWSVPKGTTEFATWQQRTIVYHEGVPGHHLQVCSAVLRSADLNRYRRLMCWVPGHGEGWALYAERLMAELGFLEEPGDRLGLVASQLLRSVRVVIDIGVHCGLPAPAEAGGGQWTYDKAWRYFTDMVPEPEATLRFELDRYLGWAGQAPSYKIGERIWLELREEARQRGGFDPVTWHREALDIGSVGLGTLRSALRPRPPAAT